MSRQKSKKYHGVYLNHLADSDVSYSIMYKNEYGKTVRFTVGKKSEGITEVNAFHKRNEFINMIRLGEDPIANRKRKKGSILDQVAEDHYLSKEMHNRNNKVAQAIYLNHISPTLGQKQIESISRKDLEKFQEFLSRKVSRNRTLSSKTVNNIMGELGAIFSYAQERDMVSSNPVRKIKPLKVDNARERFLDSNETQILIAEVKNIPKLHIFVRFALATGARSGAIHQLRKQDINLAYRIVTIKDEKTETTYQTFIEDETLIHMLREQLEKMKKNDRLFEKLFGSIHSKNLAERQLRPIFHRLFNSELDKNDNKNRVVIHTLRHTFASHLAMNGVSIYTIQKLMHHADLKTTSRYAKLSPESGRDAVRRLYVSE